MPATRAAVVAQVADVGRRVLVRRAADEAVRGVRGVLERRTRNAWVVETEDDGLAGPRVPREVADERIVAVHDEDRFGEGRDRLAPALGDQLQLP